METKEKNGRQTKTRPRTGRRSAAAAKTRSGSVKSGNPNRAPSPEVVYTQPGPFNRSRFLLQILTVVAIVLALVFGMSIFFKVDEEKILISGTQKYTPYAIREASGIQDGEGILTLQEAAVSGRIMKQLPYVEQVRIRIKLPDTVYIEVVESEVVYSVEAMDGSWWLMRSDGKLTEKTNAADAGQYTKILGIRLSSPEVGAQAVAQEPEPHVDEETGETIPVTVLASEQLELATSILELLESNGILGQATSLDVTNTGNLELWYDERFQIILGDSSELSYKISLMKQTVDYLGDAATGQVDVSFTIKEDQAVVTPFP